MGNVSSFPCALLISDTGSECNQATPVVAVVTVLPSGKFVAAEVKSYSVRETNLGYNLAVAVEFTYLF